jgi:hypothetical protein
MHTVVFMFSLSVSLASTVVHLYLCELCFLLKKKSEKFLQIPIADSSYVVSLIIQW